MRALVCREFGPIESLVVSNVEDPTLTAGKVLIAVQAASVNFPDGLMVQGKYQVKPPLPFIPGSEVAGVVEAVGEGVTSLRAGMRVAGFVSSGGFAEQALGDAQSIFPLGPGVDSAMAAAMPLTYATTYHALLDRAQLQSGETMLVLGAGGGVGLAAVELGKLMGATVIAAASSNEKLHAARSRGADHLINYSVEDLRARVKALTGDKGVDVVYDPVGGAYTEPAVRATGWRGRYLVIGFAAGEIPRIPLNLPLLKGNSLVGVFWGEFRRREPAKAAEELAQLFQWLEDGRIHPLVSQTFALEEGVKALEAVLTRQATGKVIITPTAAP